MENVLDFNKTLYVAALSPEKPKFFDKIRRAFSLFVDIIKVIIFSVPYCIEAFFRLIIAKKKKNVRGQVALITGAGNGIGKEIAFRLAREGCNIAIVDIQKDAAMNTAKEICDKFGVQAKSYHIDITDINAIKQLHLDVFNDIGSVDILVNNAGIIPKFSFRDASTPEIERVIQVNANAVIMVTHEFLESMIHKRMGHIMNIASMSAYHPFPGGIIYSTTKFAIRGFTECLTQELRLDGHSDYLHVTGVFPYFVATRKDLTDAFHLRFPYMTPKLVADRAVDGMLRNQVRVCIPTSFYWGKLFTMFLPYKVQNLIRDQILREKTMRA